MTKPQLHTFAETDFYFEYYKPEEVDAEIERMQRALAETHDAWTAETQRRVQAETEIDRLRAGIQKHIDGYQAYDYCDVQEMRDLLLGGASEFRESRGEILAQGPVPAASGETPTARLSDEPLSAPSVAVPCIFRSGCLDTGMCSREGRCCARDEANAVSLECAQITRKAVDEIRDAEKSGATP